MSDKNVVLCFPVQQPDIQKIQSAFPEYNIVVSSQDSIAKDIMLADIFCGHAKVPVDWEAVVESGRLRWIQSSAAGLDHCLVPSVIRADEICVSGCSALFANQVAEQTVALLFSCVRRMPVFQSAQSDRQFERLPTDDLHGKTIGIIGFGGNGRRIAEALRWVSPQILATDEFHEFDPPDFVKVLPASELDTMLLRCDVVIVTLPLTSSTKHYFGRNQFSAMKKGSYFINVARGKVIDQNALIESLQDRHLRFAALDVVDPEPLPESSPLWDLENILITPHVAAQSSIRIPLTVELFCLNGKRFEDGKCLLNQVDKQLQFPRPQHRIVVDKLGQIQLPNELA